MVFGFDRLDVQVNTGTWELTSYVTRKATLLMSMGNHRLESSVKSAVFRLVILYKKCFHAKSFLPIATPICFFISKTKHLIKVKHGRSDDFQLSPRALCPRTDLMQIAIK